MKNIPNEISCTLVLDDSEFINFLPFEDLQGNVTCQVKIIGNLVAHTCEHCKFWDGIDRKLIYGQCSNTEKGVIRTGEGHIYYPNTFGCIFWESK